MKQVNLIPRDYAHSRYVRRRAVVWAELVLAIAAMVAALGLNLRGRLHAAENDAARLAAKQEMYRQLSVELHELAGRRMAILGKLKDVYDTQRKRVCSAVLDEIAAACNDRVFLVEVEVGESAAQPPKMPKLRGRKKAEPQENSVQRKTITIQLKGRALTNLDLTQFVSGLSQSEILKDVNLKFWQQGALGESKLIRFEIECCPDIEG